MTIAKGQPWGEPAPLPVDGVVVRSDAEARGVVEQARRAGAPPPALGLAGGDLCRTLGGTGDEARLRSADAVTFPIDLGEVLADGGLHVFVAHLVARNRWWTRSVVAMNAQWLGGWNLGPRAHPDDGLLDVYQARLGLGELAKVRSRARHGAHLPHPAIRERRVGALQVDLEQPLGLWLDGQRLGGEPVRRLTIRLRPDALRVVV